MDASHAWASTSTGQGLHATVDGGETWSVIAGNYVKVQFVDTQHGFARLSGILDSSSDGGHNWTRILEVSGLSAMSFISPTTGWAATTSGALFKTTDGGATWFQSQLGFGIAHLAFVDAQTGWIAATGSSGIYRSTDGGATWTQSHAAAPSTFFMDISTVGTSHAWLIGRRGGFSDGTPVLVSTADGGATWTEREGKGGLGIHFVDANRGWMVGAEVLHTEDGGATWTAQEVPDGFWNEGSKGAHFSGFADVVFVNATTGWVVGDNGVILHTTTGGK